MPSASTCSTPPTGRCTTTTRSTTSSRTGAVAGKYLADAAALPLWLIIMYYQSMNNFKRYIPKKLLLGILLYVLIGLIIGFFTARESAAEDLAIKSQCSTYAECFRLNSFLIPAGMVIWPVMSLSQPVVLLTLVALFVFIVWIMNRRKKVSSLRT